MMPLWVRSLGMTFVTMTFSPRPMSWSSRRSCSTCSISNTPRWVSAPADLLEQQLGFVGVAVRAVLDRFGHPGSLQEGVGARRVTTIGAEAGQVDKCRFVLAVGRDGPLQHIDGAGGVAGEIETS